MIVDDSDAVTFLGTKRAVLRAERVGEDGLGRSVELARRWWGTGDAADVQLAAVLRELHGEGFASPRRSTPTINWMRWGCRRQGAAWAGGGRG